MHIDALTLTLRAPWLHSLKEKRQLLKSLIAKTRAKFNVSVAETARQDDHQFLVITIACVAGSAALADSILENVLNFVESNTDAELIATERL